MRVLDIGCGVGDVSLLAARLVGRYGSVTSVDIDPAALETLEARASAEGVNHIECIQADIHEWKPGRRFDAVVGRHILIHSRDPLAVVRDCAALLHERGLAAFHEYDFSVVHRGWPPTPLRERVMEVFDRFFAGATCSNIGSRLWTLFLEAGFERPDCRAEYPIGGGSDSVSTTSGSPSLFDPFTLAPSLRALSRTANSILTRSSNDCARKPLPVEAAFQPRQWSRRLHACARERG